MFHTKNARMLSESAVFALWTYAPPVVGGFQGGHEKANLLLGAVRALCRKKNAPKACCTPSLFVSHPIWPLGGGASWFMNKQFPASMGEKSKILKTDIF